MKDIRIHPDGSLEADCECSLEDDNMAAAALPAECLEGVLYWTFRTRPAWTAMTAAMRDIIERNCFLNISRRAIET